MCTHVHCDVLYIQVDSIIKRWLLERLLKTHERTCNILGLRVRGLIQCVCSRFQLVPTFKRHVLCEVKLATRETKMSAISVAAWLLSAVAFAAINNGELHYKTLIA